METHNEFEYRKQNIELLVIQWQKAKQEKNFTDDTEKQKQIQKTIDIYHELILAEVDMMNHLHTNK